ncbi:MAG: PAS domain-containing protein [Rhodobacterales bacterium]|nr:PAS domain-containing protein [Rhodobacterales bacterium]
MPSLLVITTPGPEIDPLCVSLSDQGYEVWSAGSGAEGVTVARRRNPDVVLIEPALPAIKRWRAVKCLNTEASTSAISVRTLASDATSPAGLQRVVARIQQVLEGDGRDSGMETLPSIATRSVTHKATLADGISPRSRGPAPVVVHVSPVRRTCWGYEPEEFRSKTLYHWIHPIERRELEVTQAQQVAMPQAYTFIARKKHQAQSCMWVETSCRAMRFEGEDTTIQAACRDVTEHMDRLSGEQPYLPLGGQIMAHPGLREGASEEAAEQRRPARCPS